MIVENHSDTVLLIKTCVNDIMIEDEQGSNEIRLKKGETAKTEMPIDLILSEFLNTNDAKQCDCTVSNKKICEVAKKYSVFDCIYSIGENKVIVIRIHSKLKTGVEKIECFTGDYLWPIRLEKFQ